MNTLQHDTYSFRQDVRYVDNTCATRTRCPVFLHIGFCRHILAINHCKEKGRPEADHRQSLSLRLLARPLYVAKERARGAASGAAAQAIA